MVKNKKISLVLPVYNEQTELSEVLRKYITDLKQTCVSRAGTSYEIIAVNDGSTDDSGKLLAEAARLNRNIRVINFDARYGKQAAVTAGMAAASGDCVILADIDILNPVGIIERLAQEFFDGEQIVYAYRERMGWDKFQNAWSEGFLRFATAMFGVPGRYAGRPRISLFSRNVADIITELPAKNKLLRAMDNWVGYRIKSLVYAGQYNKKEQKEKEAAAKQRYKQHGGEIVQRSKVREHTTSLVYAYAFIAITLMMFVTEIILLIAGAGFVYHFFLWVIIVMMSLVSITFLARAVMIKRVGIIHGRAVAEIYNIQNTIN